MPISDWQDLMSSTVTVELVTARDDYGKPSTYATLESYLAHIQFKTRRIVSRVNGADALASGCVWLNAVVDNLTVDARLTLPDGSTPPIISWDVVYDENGAHHTKIYFG